MSNTDRPGLRRRHWLIATPVGLAALGATAHRWSSDVPAVEPGPFESLAEGTPLGRWTVVRVHPMRMGAVPVVLSTADGARYQVDVLAKDADGPGGVANTERLSLFVANSTVAGGDGQRPTDEEQGLGAMALAQALADHAAPTGLLTLSERHRQFPRGAYRVPLV